MGEMKRGVDSFKMKKRETILPFDIEPTNAALTAHGGGKKLDDLREIAGEVNLRKLLGVKELPASCTIGDWLRRMGQNGKGLAGLDRVNNHMVREGLRRDKRREYTLDVDAVVKLNRGKRRRSGPTGRRKDISHFRDSCLNLACS